MHVYFSSKMKLHIKFVNHMHLHHESKINGHTLTTCTLAKLYGHAGNGLCMVIVVSACKYHHSDKI